MNIYDLNELSTTSESDSEYLVDARYCRTTVKCKRKALKKTIKLIHGRCVVIYRGSGDLLPIAAKDADRNCYCDFVFVCHEPRPMKQGKETSALSRPRSAINDSSTSDHDDDDDDDDHENNNTAFQKRLSKQNSFPFKTKLNDNNNNNNVNTNSSTTVGRESLTNNNCAMKNLDNNTNQRLNEQVILEEIDVDVDQLIDADEPSASIVYFPSSYKKSMSDIVGDPSR